MALTYNQLICKEIKATLEALVDEVKERLAVGMAVTNIEKYREEVGWIRGLRQAIEVCDEAEDMLAKKERGSH